MTISREDLAAAIAAGSAPVILDVRSRVEFRHGHVPGAIHIPFWLIARQVANVPASPTDPVIVYCGHGPRAWMAGAVLRRHGFRQVVYLKGHMTAWDRAGLATEKG